MLLNQLINIHRECYGPVTVSLGVCDCVLYRHVCDTRWFYLGTGMLMPFLTPEERDQAMSVLLPTWDGNQTWLVLGGASLYGAFPLAFSVLLPKFYLPIFLMVIALLFRGVVFEFRLKAALPAAKFGMPFLRLLRWW